MPSHAEAPELAPDDVPPQTAATHFDPRRFITRVGGADYLEVKWRVYWLRTQHPDAIINTELISHENSVAVFKATVQIPGSGSATGWGSEGYDDFRDYLEKAETKALGRALAALGFGTQFSVGGDEDGGRADAPVRTQQGRQQRSAPTPIRTPEEQAAAALASWRQSVAGCEEALRNDSDIMHASGLRKLEGLAKAAGPDIDRWVALYQGIREHEGRRRLEELTPDAMVAPVQDRIAEEPVRLARQRQLVDLAEERGEKPAERQAMTDRQQSFIRQMAREKGLSDQAVDAQVQELFGKRFDQLDRRDASSYIERMKTIEPLVAASR